MIYLFQVNIGPVQGFIESARRIRDLAFGSWFLSELSRAAAREIVEQNGLESLIFPAPTSKEVLNADTQGFAVANKIIALVHQDPQQLGEQVQAKVMERLHAIRDRAFQEVHFSNNERLAIEVQQIDDLPEILWAALPYRYGEYQQTRKLLEALMAARKNTRDYSPVTWGGPVPKSSISGQLESVIPEKDHASIKDFPDEKRRKIRELYERYGASAGERLSGVDLLKRQGTSAFKRNFPSTSHIATLPFLKRLRYLESSHLKKTHLEEVHKAWNIYIDEVKKHAFSPQLERIPKNHPTHPVFGDLEGSMLLDSRLVDVLYAPGEDMNKNVGLREARQALNAFYQVLDCECKAAGMSKARPDPYYALLVADGDSMGKIIDAQAAQGKQDAAASDGIGDSADARAEQEIARHRKLSQKLASFAGQVKEIVEKQGGELVYAGGDDVVAFLPLHIVLECASELARAFRNTMEEFPDASGNKPSLSAGIAIVHHLDSLHRVRELAKRAEKRAKDIPKKNAFCVILSKRSGEDYRIVGHWGDLDVSMRRLIECCRKGAIPAGTAYELRDLVLRLGLSPDEEEADSQNPTAFAEVIKRDALRILKRKLYVPRDKFPREQAEAIERILRARLGIQEEKEKEQPHPDVAQIWPVAIGEFIRELIIAQVLANAEQLAEPKK